MHFPLGTRELVLGYEQLGDQALMLPFGSDVSLAIPQPSPLVLSPVNQEPRSGDSHSNW